MRGIRVVRGMDWVGSVCRVVWRGRWRESLRCESIHDIRTLFNQAEESRSGFKPFMEYAGSYALFNWRMRDPKLGLEYDNLRLIRAFEYGLESTSSEAGFVLVHVDMVRHSGKLVDGAANALSACGKSDRKLFNDGLEAVVQAMIEVNGVMDGKQISSNWRHEAALRLMKLTLSVRYVEEEQAKRLQQLSHLHLWHHQAVHVPAWSRV